MITESDKYDIRYTELEDQSVLENWLKNPEDRFFYPISSEEEIPFFAKNWVGFSRFKASLSATFEGKVIGLATLYLMPYRKLAHQAMFYMMVDPSMRKKGVGSSLLKNLMHLAKTRFFLESLQCEIFEGSPLLFLLEKEGFSSFALQEKYIKKNDLYYHRNLLEVMFE